MAEEAVSALDGQELRGPKTCGGSLHQYVICSEWHLVGKTWVPTFSSIAHSHKYSSSSILLIAAAADSLLQLLPTEHFRLSLPLFLAVVGLGPVAGFQVPGNC